MPKTVQTICVTLEPEKVEILDKIAEKFKTLKAFYSTKDGSRIRCKQTRSDVLRFLLQLWEDRKPKAESAMGKGGAR